MPCWQRAHLRCCAADPSRHGAMLRFAIKAATVHDRPHPLCCGAPPSPQRWPPAPSEELNFFLVTSKFPRRPGGPPQDASCVDLEALHRRLLVGLETLCKTLSSEGEDPTVLPIALQTRSRAQAVGLLIPTKVRLRDMTKFQHIKIASCQNFNISKFQHVEISTCQNFNIWKSEHVKV